MTEENTGDAQSQDQTADDTATAATADTTEATANPDADGDTTETDAAIEPAKKAPAKKAAAPRAKVANASAAAVVEPATAGTTTLDSDVTRPSVTEPGDGPADTTDPTEHATSVSPGDLSDEAIAAGTVNAVKPVTKPAPKKATGKGAKKPTERFEEYEQTKPTGEVVTVRRNIDTGLSEIVD